MSFWNHASANTDGISVKSIPGDAPPFKREYEKDLGIARIKIAIKRAYFGAGVSSSGELTQRDGRYVFFDPDAVADKIIDRELVPLVQAACDQIKAMDREFRASDPSEFTDDRGATWVRQ